MPISIFNLTNFGTDQFRNKKIHVHVIKSMSKFSNENRQSTLGILLVGHTSCWSIFRRMNHDIVKIEKKQNSIRYRSGLIAIVKCKTITLYDI